MNEKIILAIFLTPLVGAACLLAIYRLHLYWVPPKKLVTRYVDMTAAQLRAEIAYWSDGQIAAKNADHAWKPADRIAYLTEMLKRQQRNEDIDAARAAAR